MRSSGGREEKDALELEEAMSMAEVELEANVASPQGECM